MNTMMSPAALEGTADSGYGITLAGFHCPVIEFGKKQGELLAKFPEPHDIVSHEDNGYVTFLAIKREPSIFSGKREMRTFRREPHKFFQDLPRFLSSTRAEFIDRMILTGSLGSISFTILYRPSESPGV